MAGEDYEARLRQVIDQIRTYLGRIDGLHTRLTPKASELAGYLNEYAPSGVAAEFNTAVASIDSTLSNLASSAGEWLQDTATLLMLRQHSNGWRAIQRQASGIADQLGGELRTRRSWQGPGATEYFVTVTTQQTSVKKLHDLAKITSETLNTCADTVLALYGGLVVVLWKVLVQLVLCVVDVFIMIGAMVSAIRSAILARTGPGVAIVLVVWAICGALILTRIRRFTAAAKAIMKDWGKATALISGTTLALNRQANAIQAHQAAALSAFPNGRWPVAANASFDDRDTATRWTVKPPTPVWTPERPPVVVPDPPNPGGP